MKLPEKGEVRRKPRLTFMLKDHDVNPWGRMDINCQASLLSLLSVDEWPASRSVYLISVGLSSAVHWRVDYMDLIAVRACVCVHAYII
jgi:hypothetical protein